MSQFSVLMIIGIVILSLVLVFVQGGLPQICDTDVLQCPDNSFVGRDSMNNCEFYECPASDLFGLCTDGIVSVEEFNDYVRVVSGVPGAGFTVYDTNVTICPVVSPPEMSAECSNFMSNEWVLRVNCSLVDSIGFYCPTDYEVIEGFKWINCDDPVPDKFKDYCEQWFKKWIMHNCPEINFV